LVQAQSIEVGLDTYLSEAGSFIKVQAVSPEVSKLSFGLGYSLGTTIPIIIAKNMNDNLIHKVGSTLNFHADEHMSITLDVGANNWLVYDTELSNRLSKNGEDDDYINANVINRQWTMYIDFGMKIRTKKGMYYSMQMAFPGMAKLGIGYNFIKQ